MHCGLTTFVILALVIEVRTEVAADGDEREVIKIE